MAQQVDAIAMLGHVNTKLAQLHEHSAIWSNEVPISSQYLFGG